MKRERLVGIVIGLVAAAGVAALVGVFLAGGWTAAAAAVAASICLSIVATEVV